MVCPLPEILPEAASDAAASDVAGAERTARHLRLLAELAEIGMELARDVRRQALEPDAGRMDAAAGSAGGRGARAEARADLGLVFARIARAVRQTVALEARLASDAKEQAQRGIAAEASRAAMQRARGRQQKARVRRVVEEAIASEATGHEAENMRFDLDERLEDPDIEAELGWRPIGVIVAAICADLGIAADLSGFSDAELGFDIPPVRPQRRLIGDGGGRSGADIGGVAFAGGEGLDVSCDPDAANAGGSPGESRGDLVQTAWPASGRAGRDPP